MGFFIGAQYSLTAPFLYSTSSSRLSCLLDEGRSVIPNLLDHGRAGCEGLAPDLQVTGRNQPTQRPVSFTRQRVTPDMPREPSLRLPKQPGQNTPFLNRVGDLGLRGLMAHSLPVWRNGRRTGLKN